MTWIVGGSSVQGTMHHQRGIPCQDSFNYQVTEDFLFACIADGSSTAPLSHKGSQFATNHFVTSCQEKIPSFPLSFENTQGILKSIFDLIPLSLNDYAQEIGCSLDDLSTTFTGIISTPEYLVAGQIGDGFFVGKNNSNFDLLLWEEQKEFINETHFLTDNQMTVRWAYQKLPSFVALGTDGLSGVAIDHRNHKGFDGFFKPFQDYLLALPENQTIQKELENFLSSDRLDQKTDDDKTLIIAQWIDHVPSVIE